MSTFRKSSACPQSHDLLAFQAGRLATPECESVSAHIHRCEFCAAEVDFYAHHPQHDEIVERTEIPAALRELAEALLANRHRDYVLLADMFLNKKGSTTFGC